MGVYNSVVCRYLNKSELESNLDSNVSVQGTNTQSLTNIFFEFITGITNSLGKGYVKTDKRNNEYWVVDFSIVENLIKELHKLVKSGVRIVDFSEMLGVFSLYGVEFKFQKLDKFSDLNCSTLFYYHLPVVVLVEVRNAGSLSAGALSGDSVYFFNVFNDLSSISYYRNHSLVIKD
ncbi:MAG: hypothetical protein ABIK31_05430 [candidate division WOR-3 bacterium]